MTLARPIALVLLLACGGCVTRQVTVTSEPPGALVYLNDREIGRTPVTTDFTWYGTYDVVARKEGYDTAVERKRVIAPWWQWVPIDLLAEIAPWQPTDRQSMHVTLREARQDEPVAAIVARGIELQRKLPATQPVAASR